LRLALAVLLPASIVVLTSSGLAFFAEKSPDAVATATIPVGTYPFGIATGDLNHDGKSDVVVTNTGTNTVAVILNTGAGTFAAPVYLPLGGMSNGYIAGSVKIADFNGDTHPDLVTGALGSVPQLCFLQIRFGDGTGAFAAPVEFSIGPYPNTIAVADFNGDGKPDVATSNTGPGITCKAGYAAIFVNDGSGGLSPGQMLTTRPRAYDIAAGDFNGDNKVDLAVRANGDFGCSATPGGIAILTGSGTGSFAIGNDIPNTGSPGYLALTDFNRDGKLDIVGPFFNNTILPLLGTGAGDFVMGNLLDVGFTGGRIVAADFNLDGKPDVALVDSNGNRVVISTGNGTGGFTETKSVGTGLYPVSLASADFDGNGRPDLAVANYEGASISIILDVSVPTAPPRTQFDFDGDFNADIAVYRDGNTPNAPSYWYILKSTSGAFEAIQLGANGDKPIPADYNGDGRAEVAVWRPSTGIWYTSTDPSTNYGAFHWGQTGDIPIPGDFDGDGKADYVVYRSSNRTWYVTKSSNGGYQEQQCGSSADKPVLGDFDGDGKADFACYRPGSSPFANSFWNVLQSSDGALLSVQFGRGEDKAVPADYDGDGKTNTAVFRPSNSTWYTSRDPAINYGAFAWGAEGDVPAPADYDHDNKADIAIYRPGSTVWYILRSSNGTVQSRQWGVPSDTPVPASFIP
jgi:hypothetical protein